MQFILKRQQLTQNNCCFFIALFRKMIKYSPIHIDAIFSRNEILYFSRLKQQQLNYERFFWGSF
jgi:hypothetical protein